MRSELDVGIVCDKWCDGDPNIGISNNYNNIIISLRKGIPDIDISILHYDELLIKHGKHIDTVLPFVAADVFIFCFLGNSKINPSPQVISNLKGKKIFIWPDTVWPWITDTIRSINEYADLHVAFDGLPDKSIVPVEALTKFAGPEIDGITPQNPDLYYPEQKEIDICFLGTVHSNRQRYIEELNRVEKEEKGISNKEKEKNQTERIRVNLSLLSKYYKLESEEKKIRKNIIDQLEKDPMLLSLKKENFKSYNIVLRQLIEKMYTEINIEKILRKKNVSQDEELFMTPDEYPFMTPEKEKVVPVEERESIQKREKEWQAHIENLRVTEKNLQEAAEKAAIKKAEDNAAKKAMYNAVKLKCKSKDRIPYICEKKSDLLKQSFLFHPDKNQGCQKDATEKMKTLYKICSSFLKKDNSN
jgi:hypothetical protein